MELAGIIVNAGLFVATVVAAIISWRGVRESISARYAAQAHERAALAAAASAAASQEKIAATLAEGNSQTAMASRADYVTALAEYYTDLLAARATGTRSIRVVGAEHAKRLNESGNRAGPAARNGITRWVRTFAENVPLGSPPDSGLMADAITLLGDRIRIWQQDPDAAARLIREDPRIDISWD